MGICAELLKKTFKFFLNEVWLTALKLVWHVNAQVLTPLHKISTFFFGNQLQKNYFIVRSRNKSQVSDNRNSWLWLRAYYRKGCICVSPRLAPHNICAHS